jgi:AraC family transcriptional regulator of arabinose operon
MDTRIATSLAVIEQRLAETVTVDSLAAAVSLSPSRFAHLFRHEVGTSPSRYLHVLRMLHARTLLERTFYSVKEVMSLVGCNDASHFSRDFRRFHGMSPRACRLAAGATSADAADQGRASSQASAAVEHIAALANERRNPPRKPRPRARAPDVRWIEENVTPIAC